MWGVSHRKLENDEEAKKDIERAEDLGFTPADLEPG